MTYEQLHPIIKEQGIDTGWEEERGLDGIKTTCLYLHDSGPLIPLIEERLNDIKKEFNLPIKIESFPNEEVIKIKLV